jgi:hypothetical protein
MVMTNGLDTGSANIHHTWLRKDIPRITHIGKCAANIINHQKCSAEDDTISHHRCEPNDGYVSGITSRESNGNISPIHCLFYNDIKLTCTVPCSDRVAFKNIFLARKIASHSVSAAGEEGT